LAVRSYGGKAVTVLRWLRVQWDRALAVTVFVAGVVALVVGWAGISDEVFAARQLPYLLSGGIGGLFLLGAGATLWLSADLRDEWHQLRRIEQRMAEGKQLPGHSTEAPEVLVASGRRP
jgi:hypothetical protein